MAAGKTTPSATKCQKSQDFHFSKIRTRIGEKFLEVRNSEDSVRQPFDVLEGRSVEGVLFYDGQDRQLQLRPVAGSADSPSWRKLHQD